MKALRAIFGVLTGKAPLSIADQGIVSAANFLSSFIVGRVCSKDEFGLYMLGFSLVVLCVNTQISLISAAYTVYSPRLSGEAHARYTGSTLVHQVVLAAGAVLLLAGAALGLMLLKSATGTGTEGLPAILGAVAAAIFFIMLKEYARQVCFAGLWTKTVLALDACVAGGQVGLFAAVAWWGGLSPAWAFVITGAVCAAVALAWLVSMRKRFLPRLAHVLPDFRQNWSFTKWIFAYNVAFIASNQLYPWLLLTFHGPEANGVYGACALVVFFGNPLIIGLGNFLGPKTAHAYSQGGAREMQRVVALADKFFLGTMTLFCLGMFLLAEWILWILFKDKYAGNGLVVAVLSVGQLVWALTVPANFGLNALERPDVSFKSLLLSLAVMFTAGVWLVWAFGPAGVACGLLAGNVVACMYTRASFKRSVRAVEARHATL